MPVREENAPSPNLLVPNAAPGIKFERPLNINGTEHQERVRSTHCDIRTSRRYAHDLHAASSNGKINQDWQRAATDTEQSKKRRNEVAGHGNAGFRTFPVS